MKHPRTWMLVADASAAKIIRQLHPDRQTGQREDDLQFSQPERKLGAIMSDRPGRSFSFGGQHRSSMEYGSDPVRERQRAFARHLAETLANYQQERAFDRLILIAEPRMLGLLRDVMPDPLRAVIVSQIDKDLVKLPHDRLVDAIAAQVPGLG